jgi:hypothetical protein
VLTFQYLETSDLLSLRLVSSKITRAASACCFRSLKTTVFGDARFTYSTSSDQLYSSALTRLIRHVRIEPCLTPLLVGKHLLLVDSTDVSYSKA